MFQYGAFAGGSFESCWQTSSSDTHDGAGGLPKHVRKFYERQAALQKKRDNKTVIIPPVLEEVFGDPVDSPTGAVVLSSIPSQEIYWDKEKALVAFKKCSG